MSLKWQPCKNRYWKIYKAWHFLKAENRIFPMVYGMSMEKLSFLLPPLRNPAISRYCLLFSKSVMFCPFRFYLHLFSAQAIHRHFCLSYALTYRNMEDFQGIAWIKVRKKDQGVFVTFVLRFRFRLGSTKSEYTLLQFTSRVPTIILSFYSFC